ncbi:MAG: RING finger domain-containing protein [Promethearchaeota archaeon]
MLLFKNKFNDTREIKGFTKDEILEVKRKLTRFKEGNVEESEINDYLKKLFHLQHQEFYHEYLTNIGQFIDDFLLRSSKNLYYNLKSEIGNELKIISQNLTNLNANVRNIKRILKNNKFLDDFLTNITDLLKKCDTTRQYLKKTNYKVEKQYDDEIYLWIEANKIKNLEYQFNESILDLKKWDEINDSLEFLQILSTINTKKVKKKGSESLSTFHFNEFFQYFIENHQKHALIYSDLIYLMYKNNVFKDYSSEEFINILERKEIVQNLRETMRPFIVSLIEDKLETLINEVKQHDAKHRIEEKQEFDFQILIQRKFSEFLPKLIEYYFLSIDKDLQNLLNQIEGTETDEFVKIINSYGEKVDAISQNIDEIDTWVLRFDKYLKPYENITDSLKKTLSRLNSELLRKKEEYHTYLTSIKDEGIRVELRKFVDDKILEVNTMMSNYEDKTSAIIREELPQLKEISELLRVYKIRIESIKSQIYEKIDEYKTQDIDTYQVIKHWEDNFNRKKQQLTFLLTISLNKIFKSFKDLIDEESILFAEITEITKQTENFEGLPMNFALSAFLAEKLTEEELRERITELNAKINNLTSSLGLYQVELAKVEEILSNKIKEKQGIAVSDVQCTVCHQYINFAKDKLITCPFCGSTYHYLCVASWLSTHNSCPMCQNNFLQTFSNMFDTDE